MKDRKIVILQKFMSETLSEEEKKEFQEYMREDESFRRKMIQAQEINIHLDEWLKNGANAYTQRAAIPIYKKRVFYIPALALAAALTLGLIIMSLVRPVNYEKMVSSEYEVFVLEDIRSQFSQDHNNGIIKYYLNKNYMAIYELVGSADKIADLDDLTALLAGIASIEEKDEDLARLLFESVSDESRYGSDAAWYLALLYLKNKNTERSLLYLDKAEKSPKYMKEVQKLRKRILKSMR